MEKYLRKFTVKGESDTTYRLYDRNGNFYIRNKPVVIIDNNIVVDNEEYEGMSGLWELIVSRNPNNTIYNAKDKENYTKLNIKTNALYRKNNPEIIVPKAERVINGTIYLVAFGRKRESIRERGSLLFRAILTRC